MPAHPNSYVYMWGMPFVVDRGGGCFRHNDSMEPNLQPKGWVPNLGGSRVSWDGVGVGFSLTRGGQCKKHIKI